MPFYPAHIVRRFWEQVEKDPLGCWTWRGERNPSGYGLFRMKKGEKLFKRYAHRLSWEIHHGAIPEGIFICHHCDNPPCVRPDHLFMGTHTENMADMYAKGRQPIGDRHGTHTHPEKYRGEEHWTRKRPELIRHGEQTGTAKLTEDQATEILRTVDNWTSAAQMADRFQVHVTTVYDIVTRRTWGHLEGEPLPWRTSEKAHPLDRLWPKIDVRGTDECWGWSGARNSRGQGIFHLDNKDTSACRCIYHFMVEAVDARDMIVHTCDDAACCNPRHMLTAPKGPRKTTGCVGP